MAMTERYAERVAASYARIEDVFRHRDNGVVPFQVADVNYWLSGETPALIPDDYFTDCRVDASYQVKKIERHMETYDDDYIPFLFPWYGTGVIAVGTGRARSSSSRRWTRRSQGTVINSPEHVRRLSLPDPQQGWPDAAGLGDDPLLPRTLRFADLLYRPARPLHHGPDARRPGARYSSGSTNIPKAVHELMEFCTEAFIRWIKVQKQEIGPKSAAGAASRTASSCRSSSAKVWLCDDDCGAISPAQYREFVVPYNARVFKEFGGGTLHFCGSAEHQIENLAATEGLVGVNNFCMGDFRQIYRMQHAFAGRIALKVCDFSPLGIEPYYQELFSGLRRRGTIVASFVSPELALNKGKYESISRTGEEIGRQAYAFLRRHCAMPHHRELQL